MIANARYAILAGGLEREGAVGEGSVVANEGEDNLSVPLKLEEIPEEQRRKGTYFFKSDAGVVCCSYPREPYLIQVVLKATLRHGVLRLAHYHVLAAHRVQKLL